ncbi:MAG: helix-hairpin-helix domain-containing protein [Rubricoccaceae bacterium]
MSRTLLVAALVTAWAPRPIAAQASLPDSALAEPFADLLEALAEDGGEGAAMLLDVLAELRARPLSLNTASADALAALPGLDRLTAEAIVRHRAREGPFRALPELLHVAGVSEDVYARLRPFLTVDVPATPGPPPPRTAPLRVVATQRVQHRLDFGEDFRGADSLRRYPGLPARFYARVHAMRTGRLSLNLTAEQDPGEPLSGTLGADFVSAHAAVYGRGRLRTLVAGDYVIELGQGVALWRAAGFGKSADAVGGPVRAGRGVRPYGSADEAHFLRGVAASAEVARGLTATAFASRRRLDAALRAADSTGLVTARRVSDGLHRTASERARRGTLGQTVWGIAAEARRAGAGWSAAGGMAAYHARFDVPLAPAARPDERFGFAGETISVATAFGEIRGPGLVTFGEATRGPAGVGAVGGLLARPAPQADVLVLARHYPPGFAPLLGYPFGERNGAGDNEGGLYVGLRLRPTRTWTLDGYMDRYRFPWLRYGVPQPSGGHDALARLAVHPRRWLRASVQARAETREVGAAPTAAVGRLEARARQSLRAQAEWDASGALRLRTRIEGVRATRGAEPYATGSLLLQDARYRIHPALRLDARLALFATEGFDARLYTYEQDLTGVFAVPALHGRGTRAYVLATLTPSGRLTVQARLAGMWRRDLRIRPDGQAEPARVRDAAVQVRYRF